jgi:hypothetical protein
MARVRATPDGDKPLTAAQETQRDVEEAAWATRTEPTREELSDSKIDNDDTILSLVRHLAAEAGVTERQYRDTLKTKL